MFYRSSVLICAVVLTGAIAAVSSAGAQTTWYVDDDAPGDPGPGDPSISDPLEDGSAEHPFDAIQEGIGAAVDGDTVLVLDGTYTGEGNNDLDFGGRAATVRSENGPDTCVIDCENNGQGFDFHSGETPESVVSGFTITNGRHGAGGGVRCAGSSPTPANCTITGNAATFGGGVYCYDSSPTLINCTITGNAAIDVSADGGGVYCRRESNPTLTNCMITGNTSDSGGGLFCREHSSPTLTNCILWGNSPQEVFVGVGSPVLSYCDIQGGWQGEGNIDSDPLLTPDGHLRADSPCRNAGDPDGDYTDQTDIDGEPRVAEARVDIGPDEFLDTDDDGLPDWWESLYFGSPTAADAADDDDADGWTNLEEYGAGTHPVQPPRTYYVDTGGHDGWDGLAPVWDGAHGPKATIQAAIDVTYSYDEVVVADGTYTGVGNRDLEFAGRRITVRSASGDPALCVIDCEAAGRGFHFNRRETAGSVVSGFTITNGLAGLGGGVYCHVSSPTLTNCTITGNAAIAVIGIEAANGGGVYCRSSSPTLINCTVTGNARIGGGVHSSCGGGVSCHYRSSPTLANCTIIGNVARSGGGVLCAWDSTPTLSNCTITANAASFGGGVRCNWDSSPTLINCILWADSPEELSVDSGSPVLSYCDIQGGWVGEGNVNSDPLLTPDGHLQADSPCRDVGDPNGDYSDQTDIDGEPRVVTGRVEIGADEFLDTDDDGLPDWWESVYFGSPTAAEPAGDEDADGWTNLEEYAEGTHPLQPPRTYYVDTGGDDGWDGLAPVWDGTHGPKATIQAAIDVTYSYDEVVVADGTYVGVGNRDLDLGGRRITVHSASADPALCVIDCEAVGRGFHFHRGEPADSVVSGFTITNGVAGVGGGVCCSGSSPTLTDCKITGNTAAGRYACGGAVYCYDSHPTLANCTITGNAAESSYDEGSGGGVFFDCDSSPTLTNCTIAANEADEGGGVYSSASSPTLANCTIERNVASRGGAVYCYDYGGSPTLANCTIRENWATSAGGVYCDNHSRPTLANCILWGDSPQEVYVYSSGWAVLSYCDVQGGWEGEGNIDGDPLLTPDGHLQADSPCRDAGDPDGDYTDQTDIDGEPRVVAGRVDIGPDEFLDTDDDGLPDWWESLYFGSPTAAEPADDDDADGWTNLEEYAAGTNPLQAPRTYYVDTRGDDSWDGLAPVWDGTHGPKATIQAAIDATDAYDEVVVADGTYTGVGNRDLDFGGKRITVASASGDPALCIIDCEAAGRGFYFHNRETADSVISGFTITNGFGSLGGAVACCYRNSPMLTNCAITGNTVFSWEDAYGAGVGCYGSSPTLINCVIRGNVADAEFPSGGGIACDCDSNPTLTNCTITGNTAVGYWAEAGGVGCYGSSPTLTNCTIMGNTAAGTVSSGGGVSCYHSSLTLTNCTVAENSAGYGAGMYCGHSGPTLTSCILWGDSPQELSVHSSSLVLTYCDVQGGWEGDGNIHADPLFVDPDGPDNDPNTWEDNDYRLTDGSPCIDAGCNCGVPPDSSDLDGDDDTDEYVPFDLDGEGRFFDDLATEDTGSGLPPIVDMGAYEFGGSDLPPCRGDLDGDRDVDWDDLVVLLDNYGTLEGANGADGDMDCDGDVELVDLAALLSAYGTSCE
jgi:hypothetical protein